MQFPGRVEEALDRFSSDTYSVIRQQLGLTEDQLAWLTPCPFTREPGWMIALQLTSVFGATAPCPARLLCAGGLFSARQRFADWSRAMRQSLTQRRSYSPGYIRSVGFQLRAMKRWGHPAAQIPDVMNPFFNRLDAAVYYNARWPREFAWDD